MDRQRNFRSVIGPLNIEALFYLIYIFLNFRFNRALISRRGAVVRHRNFQSVIAPSIKVLYPESSILFYIFYF